MKWHAIHRSFLRRTVFILGGLLTMPLGVAAAADFDVDAGSKVPATSPAKAEVKVQAPAKIEASEISPPDLVGEPLSAGIMKLLEEEVSAAIKKRGVSDSFSRFHSYLAKKLNSTAGPRTGSELTGNCRLSWYDRLLRNPVLAGGEADEFTRTLHQDILRDPSGLGPTIAIASEKLDLGKRTVHRFVAATSPSQALEVVKESLSDAQTAYAAALSPLTKSEIRELSTHLYPVMTGQNTVGHTLNDRGTGRRICDLMEKMDRLAMIMAAEALVPLTDPKLMEQLKSLPVAPSQVRGVSGTAMSVQTPAGTIVIGGKESNIYQLEEMHDVAAVIDLGGSDTYTDGSVGLHRPVLLILDLAGNDRYRATKPGAQGGAILGVSMLLDLEGDDVYEARDVAQGVATAGIGILIDYAGDDRYSGVRRLQGNAVGGLGILIDRSGQDSYRAAMWAQGVGGPLGFGMLDDLKGNDHYYCGGLYPNSYKPETPGYEGWGQGVGGGIRQVANGGIGVIVEGEGDDIYEFDYLSHGGGYWCGLGFARDFSGDDQRLICRKAFAGGERTERLFQRFGCGWGCHYSLGFCFDDRGNDIYQGTIMGSGMGWDCGTGVLCDFAGNDRYEATGGLTQGSGAQASLGILFDYNGEDNYLGYGQGYAPAGISYHDLPQCGGNFSFVIDYGNNDKYGCGAKNNSYIQRGAAGGFLIDRPNREEVTGDTPTKPTVGVTAGP